MKRKTKIKREYYNRLSTEIQKIRKNLAHWDLPVQEYIIGQIKKIKQASDLEKFQILMTYHHTEQQKKYTHWFIALTIFIIILTIVQITVGAYFIINPPAKKADIQLYTDIPKDIINLSNDFIEPKFNLYLFNGGNAPCFDTVLITHSFIQRGEIILPERKIIPAVVWDSRQKTEFYLGIINPDETIKIELDPISLSSDQLDYLVLKLNPSILKLECIDDSATKKIFLIK